MSDPGAESERTSVERLATAKCVSPPSNSMPLALIDVWNKVFWKGTREHRLLALKDDQGNVWFPYDPAFSVVHPQKSKWVELSGEGTVVSWVVLQGRYFDSVGNEMPCVVATIKLDEGPQIFSNLVNIADDEIYIGMRVAVTFRDVDERISIPLFRPVDQAAESVKSR
jgi:uncharacterized OB-fold protein